MTRRTFVAIELPEDLRDHLSRGAARIAEKWQNRGLRPVAADHIHLTLRFLGDTEEKVIPGLTAGLDLIAADLAPFHVSTDQIGGFPNLRRPRVVWAGIADAERQLLQLNRQVEQLVQSLGWERHGNGKGFTPHLTLGRIRQKSRPPAGDWIVAIAPERFGVDAICLIESVLKPHGAEYTALHRASFGS